MTNETLKAGGIIIHKNNNKLHVLLLYRGKEKDWSFPKGHIEPNEKIEETVIREMKEETGLTVKLVRELPPHEYINTRTGEKNKIFMYILEPLSLNLKTEHINDALEWVEIDRVASIVSYENIKKYFLSVLDIIYEQYQRQNGGYPFY